MSADYLVASWKEVRDGFSEEVVQIPPDQFQFRATNETRCIAEILQHIVQIQKVLVGEAFRPEPNLLRQSFAQHIQEYAPEVAAVSEKNALLELLSSSMEVTEANIRSQADRLDESIRRFDGKEITKQQFLQSAVSHEMYHRGQFTVYARLLNVEPMLTQRLKKLFATAD
jgi:uncharacterized damage-inducible protein DinB